MNRTGKFFVMATYTTPGKGHVLSKSDMSAIEKNVDFFLVLEIHQCNQKHSQSFEF